MVDSKKPQAKGCRKYMSKKEQVIELLKTDKSVEEICDELGISASYVYRIKREFEEDNPGDENDHESEDPDMDNSGVGSPGGDSSKMEGDKKGVEEGKQKKSSDKADSMGGVKKRKKSRKKKIEQKNTEQNSSENTKVQEVRTWIMKKWKGMLLALMLLILLVLMTLLPSKKAPEDTQAPRSRFPMITLP